VHCYCSYMLHQHQTAACLGARYLACAPHPQACSISTDIAHDPERVNNPTQAGNQLLLLLTSDGTDRGRICTYSSCDMQACSDCHTGCAPKLLQSRAGKLCPQAAAIKGTDGCQSCSDTVYTGFVNKTVLASPQRYAASPKNAQPAWIGTQTLPC
jgi:hypothetical protein